MYTLYHQDGARSGAALLVLEEGGLDYELRHIDISACEHRSERFLAVNPRGLIPTLVTDSGEVICETAAIMMYLADRHRLAELAPLPDEAGRGVLHDWPVLPHRGGAGGGQAPGLCQPVFDRHRRHSSDKGQGGRDAARALENRRPASCRQWPLSPGDAVLSGGPVPVDHRRLAGHGRRESRCSGHEITLGKSAGRQTLLRAGGGKTEIRPGAGCAPEGCAGDSGWLSARVGAFWRHAFRVCPSSAANRTSASKTWAGSIPGRSARRFSANALPPSGRSLEPITRVRTLSVSWSTALRSPLRAKGRAAG